MNNTTEKQQRIWQVVHQIPYGKVASYGQVAQLAGMLGCARLVGYTLKQSPQDTDLPWHRVLNSRGVLSLPKDSSAYQQQFERLHTEGVQCKNRRLNLSLYRWLP